MTAFFEYFNSQIVYDLVGPDGAYNLYEKERRSDATSTLIKTLEDIGKNQVVLYKELSKILSKEQKLEKTLKETIEKAFANGSKTENLDELAEEVFKDYFDKRQEFSDQIKHSISDAEACLKSLE